MRSLFLLPLGSALVCFQFSLAAFATENLHWKTQSPDESVSFACLTDATGESGSEFFLVRRTINAATGVTTAFDQLRTFQEARFCVDFYRYNVEGKGVARETPPRSRLDLKDSFLCVKDVMLDGSGVINLVRVTRDAPRGVAFSTLAIAEFTFVHNCRLALSQIAANTVTLQ